MLFIRSIIEAGEKKVDLPKSDAYFKGIQSVVSILVTLGNAVEN
jgi:hypothetical protein